MAVPVPAPAAWTLTRLAIPTYDGSGEVVHPDVVHVPQGWRGWSYWMAFTPFPRGDVTRENPSIVVSRDGVRWEVPAGGKNPLVPAPRSPAFNSDPDLVYDAARDRLVLFYREVKHGFNNILSMTSDDGVRWTAPRVIFRRLNRRMVSPAVAFGPDSVARVWYVDAGTLGCAQRRTTILTQTATDPDALTAAARDGRWSRPVATTLQQPGFVIWHLDVTYIPARGEYWAVYPAYPQGTCAANELFFARSADGVTWQTYPRPLLQHTAAPWAESTLYRTSVVYDEQTDRVRFYVSARAKDRRWSAGLLESTRADLFQTLEAPLLDIREEPGRARIGRTRLAGEVEP